MPAPAQSFVSRPDILAPVLDIRLNIPDKTAGGFIFLSTWQGTALYGSYIFDAQGHLIWSGHEPQTAQSGHFHLQVHSPLGKDPFLTVFRGQTKDGRGKGHVAYIDDTYETYRTLDSTGISDSPFDFHEYLLLKEGKEAIVVGFRPVQADLSVYGGQLRGSLAWLLDSSFYRIDVETKKVLFEWHAADHIPLSESIVYPSRALSYGSAFDFFHTNSVAQFRNGDYLLSARHTNTIYRVSGQNGTILWRLGGLSSSFSLQNFNFSAQHDARIIDESDPNTLTLSLYDNANNGLQQTSAVSSAMILQLDVSTMKATLMQQLFPLNNGSAENLGSIQRIPENNNTLISWGKIAEMSEFTPDGERVLDIALGDPETRIYRIMKAAWKGKPSRPPDLYLYSQNGISTHYYVSWNGATEVRSWKIYGRRDGDQGEDLVLLKTVSKGVGFETHVSFQGNVTEGMVEALDSGDAVLARSKTIRTFMPPVQLADGCGEFHCMRQDLTPPAALLKHLAGEEEVWQIFWWWPVALSVLILLFVMRRVRGVPWIGSGSGAPRRRGGRQDES